LERTFIRRCSGDHDCDVKDEPDGGEADDDAPNGGGNRQHVFAKSTGEKEEGNLEHYLKTLDEEVEWPFLQPIAFALTVSATLDHRPARVPQVPIHPLPRQHSEECGKQGDQQTCIDETGGSDDPVRGAFLDRWNGECLTGDGGLIESEEDCAEEGHRLLVLIWSEV